MQKIKKEFKVNEYITLRLEDGKTTIYVNGTRFLQCKYLLLNIPVDEISFFDEFESIDEVAQILDRSLEEHQYKNNLSPETEFWGHCSNLQAWYEHDYDTRILHSNLAFPLLEALTKAGDLLAKMVFKEEIATRLKSMHFPTLLFLFNNHYLKYLTQEEQATVLDDIDLSLLRSHKHNKFLSSFKKLLKVGGFITPNKYDYDEYKLFLRIFNISNEKMLDLKRVFKLYYFRYDFKKFYFIVDSIRWSGRMYLAYRYMPMKYKHLNVVFSKRICLKGQDTFQEYKDSKEYYVFTQKADKYQEIRISLLKHNVKFALNLFKIIMGSKEEDIKIAIPKKELMNRHVFPHKTVFKMYDKAKPLVVYLEENESRIERKSLYY